MVFCLFLLNFFCIEFRENVNGHSDSFHLIKQLKDILRENRLKISRIFLSDVLKLGHNGFTVFYLPVEKFLLTSPRSEEKNPPKGRKKMGETSGAVISLSGQFVNAW